MPKPDLAEVLVPRSEVEGSRDGWVLKYEPESEGLPHDAGGKSDGFFFFRKKDAARDGARDGTDPELGETPPEPSPSNEYWRP